MCDIIFRSDLSDESSMKIWRSCRDEDDGHNESVKSDGFGEDHEQDDCDEDVIVLDTFHANVTTDADGQTRGQR